MRYHVVLAVALTSCALPHDVAGIAGAYVMHRELAADTLVLRADGRYVRMYHAQNEPPVVDSGAWFLSRNKKLVALRDYPKRWRWVHDCMFTGPVCKALTDRSTLALSVERSRFGTFRLGWHSEFGWWYARIAKGSGRAR